MNTPNTCRACGNKAAPDCQLCVACLDEVRAMKYETPKPATFQEAVEILRERKVVVAPIGRTHKAKAQKRAALLSWVRSGMGPGPV